MSRFNNVLLAVLLAGSFTVPAWSEEGDSVVLPSKAETVHTVQLVVNDRILDSEGTIIDGCTFVPLRAVVTSMGGTVNMDKKKQRITISIGRNSAEFTMDNRQATINQRHILLSQAPRIIDGSICVPLRFFVDSCGSRLDWSNYPKTAYLFSNDFQYTPDSIGNSGIKDIFFSPHRDLVTGDTMNIEVLAPPSSKVTVDIPGIQSEIPTYEDRPGRFLAELTIAEKMKANNAEVKATITDGDRTYSRTCQRKVTVNAQNLTDSTSKLSYSPLNNAIITKRRPNITVNFDGRPLKQDSIHLWFDENEYTHQLVHRTDFAIWRPSFDLSYGKHHAKFYALDMNNVPVICDWYFTISMHRDVPISSVAPPEPVLRIYSPTNGDRINDVFSVIGRTSDNANVTITLTELRGKEIGIHSYPKTIITKTVQADATGRFDVEFDLSAVRAGHRISVLVQAERSMIPAEPITFEVVRK